MAPKKEESAAINTDAITGFTSKETKMIAAAFVASIGPDKYDYELFATLTKNTIGSLKKMWPPVKRKVIEAHPSFGAFVGAATAAGGVGVGEAKAKPGPKTKANNDKKRKATSTESEDDDGAKELDPDAEDAGKKKPGPKGRKKKADSTDAEGNGEKKPAAKRGRKKVKSDEDVADEDIKEETADEEAQAEV